MLGTEGSPEAYARLRRELKLDRPVLVRYCIWLADFVRGEWGISARYSLPVKELVGTALPFSLLLAVLAVGLSVVVAVPAGMAMVIWPSSAAGRMLSLASQVGMGLPQFWVGLLLIEIFAVRWHILPAGGQFGLGKLCAARFYLGSAQGRYFKPYGQNRLKPGPTAGLYPHRSGQGTFRPSGIF